MTLKAHRLVSKAYEVAGSAMQSTLLTLIFRSYCEDDLDIGDPQVLADAAEEAGLMSKVEVSTSPVMCWRLASTRNPPCHLLRGRGAPFISIRFG
jgi:hypothetical protein